jgi:hypothetical protein
MLTTPIPEVIPFHWHFNLLDAGEHTHVKRPEDSKEVAPLFHAYYMDVM